jgi:hypothetical protein
MPVSVPDVAIPGIVPGIGQQWTRGPLTVRGATTKTALKGTRDVCASRVPWGETAAQIGMTYAAEVRSNGSDWPAYFSEGWCRRFLIRGLFQSGERHLAQRTGAR